MKGYTTTERTVILGEMVGEMRTNIDAIQGAITLSSAAVERDIQLAADCLDHAACLLRVMQHDAHLKLFGEGDAE